MLPIAKKQEKKNFIKFFLLKPKKKKKKKKRYRAKLNPGENGQMTIKSKQFS